MMGKSLKFLLALMIGVMVLPALPVIAQQNAEESSARRRGRSSTRDDRERRREDRSKTRESRSSGRRAARESAEKPAAESTKTVDAKKKESSSSGGSSGGGGRPPLEIAFEMQVDPKTNIMYLESSGSNPSLNIDVVEGSEFVTRLTLYNPKGSEFSQLDASIKYDPDLMEPLGVDDSSIRANLAEPARILVDKQRGLLSMAADFSTTRTDSFATFAKIQWKALKPNAATPLVLLNSSEHPSGVFDSSGHNILHFRSDGTVQASPKAGLLDATVNIEPKEQTVEQAARDTSPFSSVVLATNISMGTAEGDIELALRPRKRNVQVGEQFIMDIVYRNPRRADIDTVKLKLRFDPEVLQVIDTDEGNWITRGVNIYDGAYHEQLPFDFHRKNIVYNNIGLINYEMGFSYRSPVPAEGILASIQFMAIAPASSTEVVFDPGRDRATDPDTAISFLGFNLIGKPGQRASAMSNSVVAIRP